MAGSKIWFDDDVEIFMLGVKEKLKWGKAGNGLVVDIPESLIENPPCKYAWTIKISKIKK